MTRFRSELNDEDGSIPEMETFEAVLNQTKALDPGVSNNSRMSRSLQRLEPILSQINDFSAIVALYCGAGSMSTGLLWGSLRAILTV